jgi:hypothetical protein
MVHVFKLAQGGQWDILVEGEWLPVERAAWGEWGILVELTVAGRTEQYRPEHEVEARPAQR